MEPDEGGDGRERGAHLHKVKRNRGRRKTAADIVKTQARAVLTNSYSNTQSSPRVAQ